RHPVIAFGTPSSFGTIDTTLLGRRLRCCSVNALKIASPQPRSTSLLENLGDFCLYHI
ncbi:unnamed protein product, partial [Prunus brigantina]